MQHNFYGRETADVAPAAPGYEKIKDPRELYELLDGIWCEYSCAPRLREGWSEDNKTLGQCSITAFLAQDIFGGKVYGIPRPGGNYHCYNAVGDCVFDLTSEQFGDEVLDYSDNPEQFREVHFAKQEKKERYEYLKKKLEEKLRAGIRRAQKKDIPGILSLLLQVDMVHHDGRPDIFKGPATKYNAAQLEEMVGNDSLPIYVYVDENEKVLGHAFCVHKQELDNPVLTDIKTLYIDDICVDENARGKGVGRALYEHVLKEAKKRGFYNVTLNVWSCNPAAMKFYEAMGLKPQKIGMEKIL
ncbi:MAG: GNAT family N-acetyltransferase [Lachnospiraceae bacterium]|nr:GNAT family N-acetyltransferase [Lachnospiraceae bacterium]